MLNTKSLKFQPDPKTNEFLEHKINEKEQKIDDLERLIADIDK